jgi:hypothetical protein
MLLQDHLILNRYEALLRFIELSRNLLREWRFAQATAITKQLDQGRCIQQ